jgi:hypothetical protein
MIKLLQTFILLSASALPTAIALEQAIRVFTESDETSIVDIDHTHWQEFLSETIITTRQSGINRFDYSAVSPKQKSLLANYLM